MAITFSYQYNNFKLPKQKKVVEWILLVAFLEKREVEDINYVFCNDSFLIKLNTKFLLHTTYTDIITFDYSTNRNLTAEIYISTERVKSNAANFNNTFEDELRRVIIHGVLHCIGYSDKTKRNTLTMRKKEEGYLHLYTQIS